MNTGLQSGISFSYARGWKQLIQIITKNKICLVPRLNLGYENRFKWNNINDQLMFLRYLRIVRINTGKNIIKWCQIHLKECRYGMEVQNLPADSFWQSGHQAGSLTQKYKILSFSLKQERRRDSRDPAGRNHNSQFRSDLRTKASVYE